MKSYLSISLLCGASMCVFLTSACSEKSSSSSSTTKETTIQDPDGIYKIHCDPSITKAPPENVLLGKGAVVEVHYDGSKGDGLAYQLYYIHTDGLVKLITGSSFENNGTNVYSREISIYDSSAHQRPGFMEITTLSGTGQDADGRFTGKVISLGMFPVRFELSE